MVKHGMLDLIVWTRFRTGLVIVRSNANTVGVVIKVADSSKIR